MQEVKDEVIDREWSGKPSSVDRENEAVARAVAEHVLPAEEDEPDEPYENAPISDVVMAHINEQLPAMLETVRGRFEASDERPVWIEFARGVVNNFRVPVMAAATHTARRIGDEVGAKGRARLSPAGIVTLEFS